MFSNPLDRWGANENDFPHLAKLFIKYLAKHFLSTYGLIIAKDRAEPDVTHANILAKKCSSSKRII
jgi:hypothetical protein